MKKLSISNDVEMKKEDNSLVKSPPKIVYQNTLLSEIEYLSENWINPNHLFALMKIKHNTWTSKDKVKFRELPLEDKTL